jgi:vacuolar-type H+-ATPase subunit E/Vma4
MQHAAEHFGDRELVLIYIAKRLTEALRLENLLTEAGLDYLVEPDKYSGGVIFQSERVGAFFYVAPPDEGAAKDTLSRNGFRPYKAE